MTSTEEAVKSVDEWAELTGQGPKKGCVTKRTMALHAKFVEEAMVSKDWSKAKAGHVVALFIWCHTKVYTVAPGEMTNGYEYLKACAAVARFIKKEFSGNVTAAIAFVRWTWQREAWREQKRRENDAPPNTFRIGWSYQFGTRLLTDYRIDQARKKGV